MAAKIIEAEYHVQATHFWEINHIEGWPRDSHGPLPIESAHDFYICLLYTSPSPRDGLLSRMPSSA